MCQMGMIEDFLSGSGIVMGTECSDADVRLKEGPCTYKCLLSKCSLADLGCADPSECASSVGTSVPTTGLLGASIQGGGIRPSGPAAPWEEGGMRVRTEFLGDLVLFWHQESTDLKAGSLLQTGRSALRNLLSHLGGTDLPLVSRTGGLRASKPLC